MVLERLLDAENLIRKPIHLFLLAIFLSFIGIISAAFLFPNYLGLMSIAFISLLLFPFLSKLCECEAKKEFSSKEITFKSVLFQHSSMFKNYLILTLAIFLSFLFIGFILPTGLTSILFKEQMSPISNGLAASGINFDFHSIAQNNLKILYVTFAISLIYGAGVVIMLSWNASVWGIIIGTTIKDGLASAANQGLYLFTAILSILPHLVLETMGYLGAAVAGGILTMCIFYQRIRSKRFFYTLTDVFAILSVSILLIIISAFIEINI